MEKFQKRALRLVLNDHTSSNLELLEKVNRPPLYVSRIKTIATEIFKCLTEISPNFVKNIFAIGYQPFDLRRGSKIIQTMVNSKTSGLKSMKELEYGISFQKHWKMQLMWTSSKITSATGQD